ncbi:MAG: hypothetical protein V7636_1683 [Actinomycetota bacterium]
MRRLALVLVVLLVLTVSPARAATVRRIAGPDRYATAAAIGQDRWNDVSDTFVANGSDPSDALAAAFGAGLHGSPIFLTARDAVPQTTLDALRGVHARRVHVLGGSASVSDGVVATLRSAGYEVDRLAGADRYGTAVAVARSGGTAIIGSWGDQGRTALVANGSRPFDALAAGPLAAGQLFPILLVQQGSVPKATSDGFRDLAIKHVVVLGGTGAISDDVVTSIKASGITVRRVAGADRMESAIAIAGLLEEFGYTPKRASLVSATSFADSLGGGTWGAPDAPVLLCQTASFCGTATNKWAHTHALDQIIVMGGTNAVSDVAAMEVAGSTP